MNTHSNMFSKEISKETEGDDFNRTLDKEITEVEMDLF